MTWGDRSRPICGAPTPAAPRPTCHNRATGATSRCHLHGGSLSPTKALALAIVERDSARAVARLLAHAYRTDNRPPPHMVAEALSYPIVPATLKP